MNGLFPDRCPCNGTGHVPSGAPCLQYPRCLIEDVIWPHRGRAQAISIYQITSRTRLGAREIKKAVHELRLAGVRIGSCRSGDGDLNAGYFMIESADELRDFLRSYYRQAITELRVVHAMLGKNDRILRELEGQLSLDLGEKPAA